MTSPLGFGGEAAKTQGGSRRCRLTQGCGFVRSARETLTLGYVDQRRWRKEQKTSPRQISIDVGGADLHRSTSTRRTKILLRQKDRTQKNGGGIFLRSTFLPLQIVLFGPFHRCRAYDSNARIQ
jgi:hypothetical protein